MKDGVRPHSANIIGHQRISQITVKDGTEQELYFTFDGHGSTRVLTDLAGAVAELNGVDQIFHYDAYGNAVGFDPAAALTEFLYSGEQFDSKIGQQYLRARYYDPATGRFNRLDPFFGNHADPQSFHKYAYVHADPVNMVDPSGLFGGMVGLGISMSVGGNMRGMNAGAVVGAYRFFTNVVQPILEIPQVVFGLYLALQTAQDCIASGNYFAQARFQVRTKFDLGWGELAISPVGVSGGGGGQGLAYRANLVGVSLRIDLHKLFPGLFGKLKEKNLLTISGSGVIQNGVYKGIQGSVSWAARWETPELNDRKWFVEFGVTGRIAPPAFIALNTIGFYGRLVHDLQISKNGRMSTQERTTLFQFRLGGTAGDIDQ